MRPTYWIAGVALVGLTAFAAISWQTFPRHRLHLKTYFADAQALRVGAAVQVAGVEVGEVSRIVVHPELREHPAEVQIVLRTPYELKVPRDAFVTVGTAGVLGQTFAQIDVSAASGPALEDGGVLASRETKRITPQEWLEAIDKLLAKRGIPTPEPQAESALSPKPKQ